MARTLYLVGGPMGVGKTTLCRLLEHRLPACAFLDGDWCWEMDPFVVNEETRRLVLDNIVYLLNSFLHCSVYENVVFGWVLHLPESVTEPKPMTIASGVRISRLEAAEPAAKTTPAPAADAEQGSAPAEKTSLTNTPSEPSKEASVQTTKPIQPAVPGTKLIWPARGPILSDFAKNGKGLDIGGKVGSIVVAAGAGQVLFVGDGVKGYGNLVIIKHSPTIVTAYGHNSKIVVKVGQSVKAGQKIAELGQSDASEPMLRFEVRDKGKPVDPMRFMAPRR